MRLRPPGPRLGWRLIVPVVSGALLGVGLGMAVCAAVAAIGGDGATEAFAIPAAVLTPLAAAGLLGATRLRSVPVRARDGLLAVTLSWVLAAAAGAVPFLVQGTFGSYGDAFFESMSGFSTTGATLLGDVEAEPDAILLWRSLSHWIGGIGIVVLVVAIVPATGLATQRAFYAETTGVTAERLTPRIATTAKIICTIYVVGTLLALGAFAAAGMGLWDALNHGLSAISTGGFSTRTASLGAFDSVAVEVVAIVTMVAAGVNFSFYYMVLRRRDRLWPQLAEVRAYLLFLAAGTAIVTAALLAGDHTGGFGEAVRQSSFTVVSLVTGTGFTTADYDDFPEFARTVLFLALFVGGCAGSTAGGLKVIRVMLLAKAAVQEVQRQLQPKAVQVLRVRGKVFTEDVRRGVFAFFGLYVSVFAAGTLVMAACGLDPETAASASAATLNITGPGFGEVGGAENFQAVPEGGRWALTVLMLIGRLEVFTVLVLLTPAFWRPSVA